MSYLLYLFYLECTTSSLVAGAAGRAASVEAPSSVAGAAGKVAPVGAPALHPSSVLGLHFSAW